MCYYLRNNEQASACALYRFHVTDRLVGLLFVAAMRRSCGPLNLNANAEWLIRPVRKADNGRSVETHWAQIQR